PLDAVDVVERVVPLRESEPAAVAGQPATGLGHRLVFGIDAAARVTPVGPQVPAVGVQLLGGDGQPAQAGDGHGQARAAAGVVVVGVNPAAVRLLVALVVVIDRLPNGPGDVGPGLPAGVQAEQGVLRVRVVGQAAPGAAFTVAPAAELRPGH